MSAKRLGVFCSCPEQYKAGRGGEFGTLSGPLAFVGELISASLNSGTVSEEGDSLRRMSSFWMGSGVISF